MGTAVLAAIAGFAEAFANPVTLAAVLALAFLLPRAGHLRLAVLPVGVATALPALPADAPLEAALAALGAVAASLLFAEIALHFVLPACRLARRMATAVWEILSEATALLFDPGPRRAAPPPGPGGEPKRPPAEPEP